MATIDMIRRSDGRTYYSCGTSSYPPTNPKAGSQKWSNTLIWNARTRATTMITPRINPVDVDSWTPKSSLPKSESATYSKPPTQTALSSPAGARTAQPQTSKYIPTLPSGFYAR